MEGLGKRFKPEQLVNLLREIDVLQASSKTLLEACKEAGISDKRYYRGRKIYGGLKVDQAKRFKESEAENTSFFNRVIKADSLHSQLKPFLNFSNI